jgi:predicted RNA-binding Zn-ribbon protein involved in translation (DUF1610 family)
MWDLEEYPLGEETGLPLIPCPDCGLARVIERCSAKETTKKHLRVYFKCPRNGVSIHLSDSFEQFIIAVFPI